MAQDYTQAWRNWEPSVMSLYQSYHLPPYQVEHNAQTQLVEREHMFEKPLTPSDVGKLNRLVIPKQHAEKYFPLDSGGGESVEKGLLLSFEDESGKPWSFRYSYWTSSQSYVLTKGWSRFVKEKMLNAGDVVVFWRLRSQGDRFFIGCRRRGGNHSPPMSSDAVTMPKAAAQCSSACYIPMMPSGDQMDEGAKSAAVEPENRKRLRLFGVNLYFGP